MTVLPDGSMQVQHRFTVQLGPTPVSEFRWPVPAWHFDDLSNVSASMDGAEYRRDSHPGFLEIHYDRDREIKWQFAPASSTHVFGLSYLLKNAVFESGIRGTASFLAIPSGGRPNISSARIAMAVPDTAVLLEDPWVEESGWKVTREAHGMTASRAPVPAGESATVGLEFAIDAMHVTTPDWQRREDFIEQFVPAWISGAVFILIVAAGILWMVRLKFPRWKPAPDDAAPARAGEAVELWRVQRRRGRAIVETLITEGLVDRERLTIARDLLRAGVAVIVIGLAVLAVTRWAVWQYGAWSLVLPWSIVVGGFLFVVGAARFPILTEAGARSRVLYCARISDGSTTA